MDAQSSAVSILGSLDSLLVLLGDSVQDRLFRIEKSQPGSIRRSLLRTQGRLTSKLEHRDNAHLKVMMVGPVADSLARRIGEIADPESGVLSVVDFRLNRVSESLRASALGARGRVASQLNRAQTLIATRTNLQSTHAGLMGRLSGDVMIDQQVRREITDVENQLAGLQREEVRVLEELRSEADALRQKIDGSVQLLSGYTRLGFSNRSAIQHHQSVDIALHEWFLSVYCGNESESNVWDTLFRWLEIANQPGPLGTNGELDRVRDFISQIPRQMYERHVDSLAFVMVRSALLRLEGVVGEPLRKQVSVGKWKIQLGPTVDLETIVKGGNVGRPGWQPLSETLRSIRPLAAAAKEDLASLAGRARHLPGQIRGYAPFFAKKAFYWVGAVWDGYVVGSAEYDQKIREGRSANEANAHAVADGVLVAGTSLAAGATGAAIGTAVFPGVGTAAGFLIGVGFSIGANVISRRVAGSDQWDGMVDTAANTISSGVRWAQGLLP